jgi:hypothetical protein
MGKHFISCSLLYIWLDLSVLGPCRQWPWILLSLLLLKSKPAEGSEILSSPQQVKFALILVTARLNGVLKGQIRRPSYRAHKCIFFTLTPDVFLFRVVTIIHICCWEMLQCAVGGNVIFWNKSTEFTRHLQLHWTGCKHKGKHSLLYSKASLWHEVKMPSRQCKCNTLSSMWHRYSFIWSRREFCWLESKKAKLFLY